jgi:ATP-binding cassette, subfamily C (CFTR/MRP), member 1
VPRERAIPWHSRLLFSWIRPLLDRARRGPTEWSDLLPLDAAEEPEACAERFSSALGRRTGGRSALLGALWEIHAGTFLLTVLLGLVHAGTSVAALYWLRELLQLLNGPAEPATRGVLLSLAVFLAAAMSWLAIAHNFFLGERLALRVRAALIAALYRNAATLAPHARDLWAAGQAVNLVSTDTPRASFAFADAANLVMSMAMIGLSMALLYSILGPSAVAGVATLVMLVAASMWRTRAMETAVSRINLHTDRRIGLVEDLLAGIRTLKLQGREPKAEQRLASLRDEELQETRGYVKQKAVLDLIFLCIPALVAVVTFTVHVSLGHPLVVADVFAAVAVFGLLRPALLHTPRLVASLVEARVSLLRLERFLLAPKAVVPPPSTLPPGSVRLARATFAWRPDQPVLRGCEVSVEPGELVVVLGPVGSGKSALLASILGETLLLDGHRELSGRVGWVPQPPFIFSGSIRDNIVFYRPFDPERYRIAVDVCELEEDLRRLDAGDATALSDGGANLSGGQRQRIDLARAVYGEADVLLFDDLFRALDNAVAKRIMERCLLGRLRGKTRILATSRVDLALSADRVVVIEDGRIVESGSPGELRGRRGSFSRILERWQQPLRHAEVGPAPSRGTEEPAADERAEPGRAVAFAEEERVRGAVDPRLYLRYLALLAPGATILLLVALFAAREALGMGSDLWLAYWSTANHAPATLFILGFSALCAAVVVVTFARTLIVSLRGLSVARHLHASMVGAVLRSPLSFFETTPAGRILNRFSADVRRLERELPSMFLELGTSLASMLAIAIVIVVATPIAIVVLLPIALAYVSVQGRFRPAVRDVKQLDSVARSPIIGHLAETLLGLATVRAYRVEGPREVASFSLLRRSQQATYAHEALFAWLSFRLEFLGTAITGAQSLIAVLSVSTLSPGLVALSLTYTMMVTYTFGRAVRTLVQLEDGMNAVERSSTYARLPSERWAGSVAVDPDWPREGRVELEELELRYRPELEPALRGVSFTVAPGERVGIVGRTGSGKSSLMAALLRLSEPSAGRIRIDGVDIGQVDLSVLRDRIEMIPQDPHLFEGTIRSNIDPDLEHGDEAIEAALRRVHADTLVARLPGGLDEPIRSGGANLSSGQRQLLCVARALLRRARILLLDEATSSVDHETAGFILQAISEAFRGCTVITIAHRLQTVMDSDRILVMDAGRVLEVDTPAALLADERGELRRLIASDGPEQDLPRNGMTS